MRHLRSVGRVAAAAAIASVGFLAAPPPVAAECSYIPPLPKISTAIPTARELFVGQVVSIGTNGDGNRHVFQVRIDDVLRGPATVGTIRDFRNVAPNWPWTIDAVGSVGPSCSTLNARLGEKVAIALGARWPGGTLHQPDYGTSWYQPPTIFNTMAILEGSSREQYGSEGRQLFSLDRLRELAALSAPPTDTLDPRAPATASAAAPDIRLAVLLLAGVLGGAGSWRRSRRRS